MTNTNPPEYVRCIKQYKDTDDPDVLLQPGDVFPTTINGNQTMVRVYDEHGNWNDYQYNQEYFAPATEDDFDQTIKNLSQEAKDLAHRQPALESALKSLCATPTLQNSKNQTETETSTALTLTNKAGQMRNNAYSIKAQTQKTKEKIQKISKNLKAKMHAKMAIAEIAIEQIQKFAGKCAFLLDSLNLYLGSAEEIKPLRDGAPTAPSTPISIRQLVLYMDEECAMSLPHGTRRTHNPTLHEARPRHPRSA
jgi:hypothetical protein